MRTPWGTSDDSRELAPGVTWASTPSHGGIKLKPKLNDQVPEYMRSEDGWYEEDVDWAIVAVVFPEIFDEKERASAKKTLKNYYPDSYQAYFNESIKPGESRALDEKQFLKEHKDDYLVMAAWGDWKAGIPKGYAGVFAGRGGRTSQGRYPSDVAYFLVPEKEYDQRGPFGFVIDESRHQRIEEIQ